MDGPYDSLSLATIQHPLRKFAQTLIRLIHPTQNICRLIFEKKI
jgi:hypothetical protein